MRAKNCGTPPILNQPFWRTRPLSYIAQCTRIYFALVESWLHFQEGIKGGRWLAEQPRRKKSIFLARRLTPIRYSPSTDQTCRGRLYNLLFRHSPLIFHFNTRYPTASYAIRTKGTLFQRTVCPLWSSSKAFLRLTGEKATHWERKQTFSQCKHVSHPMLWPLKTWLAQNSEDGWPLPHRAAPDIKQVEYGYFFFCAVVPKNMSFGVPIGNELETTFICQC